MLCYGTSKTRLIHHFKTIFYSRSSPVSGVASAQCVIARSRTVFIAITKTFYWPCLKIRLEIILDLADLIFLYSFALNPNYRCGKISSNWAPGQQGALWVHFVFNLKGLNVTTCGNVHVLVFIYLCYLFKFNATGLWICLWRTRVGF